MMLSQLTEHQMAGEWDTESPLDSPEFAFLTPPTPTSNDDFYNFETGPVPVSTQSSHFVQFSQAQQGQRSFREWVAEIVSQFMVRGTNSPMQWLLDLRRLRIAAIDVYLQRVAHFREKLAIAVHVSGGQLARAPELLSIRHYNTNSGGYRNIFIEDGLVA
ncbi:hypothetical protein PENANT_c412G08757, partial [Penicillium antarcticum]